MSSLPRVVGMIHLLPLPGSPSFGGSMDQIITSAVTDANTLKTAGFSSVMIENFGDTPFFPDAVPSETIAAMTVAVEAVGRETGAVLGVNVLRNDAMSALGIAAATGARMVRVNVLTGSMNTDQGPIVGNAAEVLRKRAAICPEVEIWADVMVKHASPPHGADARLMASDTVERGLADAVIVSGSGTGAEPDLHEATIIKAAVPSGTRVVIGSGADVANLSRLMSVADTVIVGSAIKVDGDASQRVDPLAAAHFIQVAEEHGLA